MPRSKLLVVAQIAFSAALLAGVLLVAHPRKIVDAFTQLSPARLAPAVALALTFLVVKFLKWQLLVRPHLAPFGFGAAARTYLIGGSLGIVTPGSAGEIGRAAFFPAGVRAQVVYLTIVDRVTDAVAVALLAIAAAFRYGGTPLGGIVVALGLLLALSAVVPGTSPRVRRWLGQRLGSHLAPVPLAPREALRATGLALVAFFAVGVEFWCLLAAFVPAPAFGLAFVAPLIILTKLLPISVMGLGVREGASVLLLARDGIAAPIAVSVSLLLFALNTLIPALVGVGFVARQPLGTEPHGAT